MCGIAGIVGPVSGGSDIVRKMTGIIRHRGPDAEGFFCNAMGTIHFGHRRLSVLDLSASANQPFFSADGRYVVIYNGEVFNYRKIREELASRHGVSFRTSGDTEVIVEGFAVWGKEVVHRLEGMFAFAIADLEADEVFLCRDRAGKKPLFYRPVGSNLYFASEIKALTSFSPNGLTVRPESVSSFLHLGFIPEPHTIYREILRFPAAHIATVRPGSRLMFDKYWSPEEKAIKKAVFAQRDHAVSALEAVLERSVENRLISDVPLGAFLSGGTDSSLVTAIASSRLSLPVRTFSIAFREEKFNEGQYAERVASSLNTDHTSFVLTQNEAKDILESCISHFDEPFADASAVPTMLVSKLARKEVTVALTGDGGDELFQGYGSYTWANRLDSSLWKYSEDLLRFAFRLSGNDRLQRISHLLGHGEKGIRSHIFSQEQYFFSSSEIADLRVGNTGDAFSYDDPPTLTRELNAAERQAIFDFHHYLKDDLLVKVDRSSMFYGLECRCPLLDHSVIEFAFSLPYNLKVYKGETKWLLKQLLLKYLPESMVFRKKWGFSIPLAQWLKGDLRYLLDQYLNESLVRKASLVQYEKVAALKQRFINGSDYLYNRVWVLIVLHKWWKENAEHD